ncbi:hypothetical protein KSP40_PGU003715 [Platanthera guangdongensis]|uniref:DUF6857 domain-containing protein n=1 Tax=Platanthera guangdongensis TaxID=2320717 RepID=A0ABR2LVS9_9ASPA
MTPKVVVYDLKWTDGNIPLDNVSKKLVRLGKDAIERWNIASKAAVDALEESLAMKSLIRSSRDNTIVAEVVFHLRRVSGWIDVVLGKSEDEILNGNMEQGILMPRASIPPKVHVSEEVSPSYLTHGPIGGMFVL